MEQDDAYVVSKLFGAANRNDHETHRTPHRASTTLDRAVQSRIGLRRGQRSAQAGTRNRMERGNDRRLKATVVRRLGFAYACNYGADIATGRAGGYHLSAEALTPINHDGPCFPFLG